jgi:hypothetical protein
MRVRWIYKAHYFQNFKHKLMAFSRIINTTEGQVLTVVSKISSKQTNLVCYTEHQGRLISTTIVFKTKDSAESYMDSLTSTSAISLRDKIVSKNKMFFTKKV